MDLMNLGDFTWDGMVEDLAQRRSQRKRWRQLMTKDVITVKEDSTLMECVDHMIKNNVKRVPVLNKDRQGCRDAL